MVPEVAEVVVSLVLAGVDVDLVVERAAADVVDLCHDVLPRVLVVLAVLGVGGELVDETLLDGDVLVPGVGPVPDTAEAEGLNGAVLRVCKLVHHAIQGESRH